jgi:archaetidylinositol phosphate synthase
MSYNTWIHKFARHLVVPLVDTPITPNHLTTGRLVFGLGAAVCFGVGEITWNVAGALAFIVSMVLDRADGELARLSGKSSRFGAIYDLITDAICNAALFIGLGVAAMNGGLGAWGLVMGIVAGICISIIFYAVIDVAASIDPGAAAFNSFAGFDPDDAMIIVPIGAVLGYGQLLLTLATIITPFVAIFICHDMYKRRQSAMRDET